MTSPPRAPRRRLDPWLPVVTLVSAVVFALHGFRGFLARDLAIYAYAGQQVADGVAPYDGILNRAGPLAHLLPGVGAWGARLLGIDDLLGMRALYLLLSVACVSVTYVVAREVFGSRLAGLAAAAALTSFAGFVEYATYGPREKTPMVLLLLLALWAIHRRSWFLAGVLVGLATLVLQIAFFVGTPALVAAALATGPTGRARLRWLVESAAGGLASLLVFVLGFLAIGRFDEFLEAFLLINVRYTTASGLEPLHTARQVVNGFGYSTVLLVAGLVAVLGLAVWSWARSGRPEPRQHATLVAMAAGVVVGVLWSMRDFDNWPDAFPLLPLAALGVGGALYLTVRTLPARYAVGIVTAFCLCATGLGVHHSVAQRNQLLDQQRASVKAVLDIGPDDATILSIQAPQPLVLSGQTNPTRYQMFASGLGAYVADTHPGGMGGFRRWVLDTEPTFISIGSPRARQWALVIKGDYRRIGCPPGWTWYADRSLPRETMLRLTESQPRCNPDAEATAAPTGRP